MTQRSRVASAVVFGFTTLCMTLLIAGGGSGTTAYASDFSIVHMSDFHMDPFYGTENAYGTCTNSSVPALGISGCDASETLVASAIADLAKTVAALEAAGKDVLVIYTGDYLRHQMKDTPGDPIANAQRIYGTIMDLFKKAHLTPSSTTSSLAFADGPAAAVDDAALTKKNRLATTIAVLPALVAVEGNEDFVPHYHFNVSAPGENALLNWTAATMQQYGFLNSDQADQFSQCGFTSRRVGPLPSTGATFRVLHLNTVLWSPLLKPSITTGDPCGQLAWMETELDAARAAGDMVYIQGHIPPSKHYYWYSILDAYLALIQSYDDVIAAQFFGHTHRLEFGGMGGQDGCSGTPPMFGAGAVTRKSWSTPQYSVMDADASTGEILSLYTRYLDPSLSGAWVSNDANRLETVLQIPNLQTCNLYNAGYALLQDSNSSFWPFFTLHMGGFVPNEQTCDSHCREKIACTTIAFTKKQIDECST